MQVIRKGMMVVPNASDYGAADEAKGVSDRLRTKAGMQREIDNRKAAVQTLEAQLKVAKGSERAKIKELIKKYNKKIKALEKGLKAKTVRQDRRKRFWERTKLRVGVYSGPFGAAETAASPNLWEQYTDWWKEQNLLVQIAVPSLFLLGSYKAVKAVRGK